MRATIDRWQGRLKRFVVRDAVAHNLDRWRAGLGVDFYTNDELEPVEAAILADHAEALRGRVLELGPGAGRVTGHLIAAGGEVHAIDISPPMIERARARHPEATYLEGDVRDLSAYEDASFDAVVAACNLLDVFDQEGRELALDEVARITRPGGLLVMSSRNRAPAPHPWPLVRFQRDRTVMLWQLRNLPERMYNRRRLRPFEREEEEYALINDDPHHFQLVHYFINPDAATRQLARHGFRVTEIRDRAGRVLDPAAAPTSDFDLHYVAVRDAAA